MSVLGLLAACGAGGDDGALAPGALEVAPAAAAGAAMVCTNPPPSPRPTGTLVMADRDAQSAAERAGLAVARTCYDLAYGKDAAGNCRADAGAWHHAVGDDGNCYSMYAGAGDPCVVRPARASAPGTLASLEAGASAAAASEGLVPSATCVDKRYTTATGACLSDGVDAEGRHWYHGASGGYCYSMYGANGFDPAPAATSAITVEAGSQEKVCQLVGNWDAQRGARTVNLSDSRFGVENADLGTSFEHKGKVYFLWGDTIGANDEDAISFSSTTLAELKAMPADTQCARMDFVSSAPGTFVPIKVPGVSMGAFGVPSGGFSYGGKMYIFVTHAESKKMVRSHLAVSADDGKTFADLMTLSEITGAYPTVTGKFINVSPVVINDASKFNGNLPIASGAGVLMMGSGEYRKSHAYLAFIPAARLGDRAAVRYFAGFDGKARWSADEADAVPVARAAMAADGKGGIGELSFHYVAALGKWVLMYNRANVDAGTPPQVAIRFADHFWGDFSAPLALFEKADGVADGYIRDSGGCYGPYLIPRFTEVDASNPKRVTLYYTISTWQPYTAVLERTTLLLP